MPHVQITWVEGRTPEQKRKIAERITNILIEDGRAKRENIHVAFHDVAATNYAEAGVLVADQKRSLECLSVPRVLCCRRAGSALGSRHVHTYMEKTSLGGSPGKTARALAVVRSCGCEHSGADSGV